MTSTPRVRRGRLTTRTGDCRRNRRQVFLNGASSADTSLQGRLDPLRELLERQPARKKMLAKQITVCSRSSSDTREDGLFMQPR